ncbi:glycosyltransferase family 4 protein [Marinobacter sp. GN3S48]|uniref:glycosyltransferase family 4 protein n=1 Tax=Marinobacter sp. GN3S48 TaxID=3382302 RepID=UPI00387B355A
MALSTMALAENDEPVTFVVPGDPDQNTGGYRYVGRLVDALNRSGQRASVLGVAGQFPLPDDVALEAMDRLLAQLPEHSLVVLDGLAMGGMPEVIARHRKRLALIALVHHPLADETGLAEPQRAAFLRSETKALSHVRGVVATSDYTARRLADFNVAAARIRVATPGVDVPPDPTPKANPQDGVTPEEGITELLCVAHLSPRKAQLHLVEALGALAHLPWHCTLVGPVDRDSDYGRKVVECIRELGLGDRISVAGELDAEAVARAYQQADLFVFPSLYEGYGMAIDEALAAGVPVVTTDGGALNRLSGCPGVRIYPAGDTRALEDTLATLLTRPDRLAKLQHEALAGRTRLRTWSTTATDFLEGVQALVAETRGPTMFEAGWLALREPADHQARDRSLTRQAIAWLERRYQESVSSRGEHRPVAIADLGSGAGSNACYLVPALGVPQHWTLLDQDAELMATASTRIQQLDIPFATVVDRLTPQSLEFRIPADVQLLTASALIDLVSGEWLETLADCALSRRAAVFIVLSYAGHFDLDPGHEDDNRILTLVNDHQHGDKGDGAALGPDACRVLSRLLDARGYSVSTGASPWVLAADQADLQDALLRGWAAAAIEQSPADEPAITRWLQARSGQSSRGELVIRVDHLDLLALPPVERHG